MRVILPCAGDQTRWGHPLYPHKQLVPIFGEPLLHRTVRQLQERGVTDIGIVAVLDEYFCPGAVLFPPRQPADSIEIDKLLSSRHGWSTTDRTTVLFGDVVFSEAAMATIACCNKPGVQWFGRMHLNPVTGGHSEVFGLTFLPENAGELRRAAKLLRAEHVTLRTQYPNTYRLRRQYSKAKRLYKQMHPDKATWYQATSHWTTLYDITEDFDCAEDYTRWTRAVPYAERGKDPDISFPAV